MLETVVLVVLCDVLYQETVSVLWGFLASLGEGGKKTAQEDRPVLHW